MSKFERIYIVILLLVLLWVAYHVIASGETEYAYIIISLTSDIQGLFFTLLLLPSPWFFLRSIRTFRQVSQTNALVLIGRTGLFLIGSLLFLALAWEWFIALFIGLIFIGG